MSSSIIDKIYSANIVGNDISYSCTNTPGVWHIKVTMYRDCSNLLPLGNCSNGCGSSCNWRISWKTTGSGCGNYHGDFSVYLTSVSDANPNLYCPNSKSICTNMGCETAGTFTPGIEKYIYEGDVNLGPSVIPSTCCNVKIFYEISDDRDIDLNTILYGQGYYFEAILNRCAEANNPCNNSPELSNDPSAIICGGQPFVFNNGAIDPDHDSLTFAFAPALKDTGVSVVYVSPYTYLQPMPFVGLANAPFPLGISCNPQTGDIMFTPYNGSGMTFHGVMTIEIKQWRNINGVAICIGITRRDIEIWLVTCTSNHPPQIITNPSNGSPPTLSYQVCAGNQICFDVIGKDTDFSPYSTPSISDTTYISWNASLASKGATFLPTYNLANRKLTGPREDKYQFCWQPSDTDVSTTPYYFNVITTDTHCPNSGKASRAISILVLEKPDISFIKHDLGCGKWSLSYINNKPLQTFASIVWNISKVANDYSGMNVNSYYNIQFPSIQQFSDTGIYLIELVVTTQGSCIKHFFDTIYNTYNFNLNTGIDTTVCSGSKLKLKPIYSGGIPPYSFLWYDTLQNNVPVSIYDSLIVSPTSAKCYLFKITDSNSCILSNLSNVRINILPSSSLPSASRICSGSSYTLDPGNNSGNVKNYIWSTGDSTRLLTRNDSNTYWVKITDTLGCENFDTLSLFINPLPKTNSGYDSTICSGQSITLQATGASIYKWFILPYSISISDSSTLFVSPSINSSYRVLGTIINFGVSCSYIDTVNVNVNPLPKTNAGNDSTICSGQSITLLASGAAKYTWYILPSSISLGNSSKLNVTPTNTSVYRVIGIDSSNCDNADTIKINVNPKPITPIISGPVSVIINETNTYNVINNLGAFYSWFVNNGKIESGIGTDSVSVIFTSIGIGKIKVIESANNCSSDTSSESIDIKDKINQQNGLNNFKIFPNPTTGLLNIEFETSEKNIDIEVIDLLGRSLLKTSTIHKGGLFQKTLNISQLNEGFYFLKITAGEKSITVKVTLK